VDLSGEEHGQPHEDGETGDISYSDPLLDLTSFYAVLKVDDSDQEAWLSLSNPYALYMSEMFGEMLQLVDVGRCGDSPSRAYGRTAYGAAEAFFRINGPQSGADSNVKSITLQERIDNIAKSITQGLRASVYEEQTTVTTTAYRDGILYAVSWRWIALPACLVVLTFLVLALTIWDTTRKGLDKWADSSFALIAFGGDGELQQALSGAGDLRAMKSLSKKQFVNLGPDRVLTARRL
jgi:hypothetical protein